MGIADLVRAPRIDGWTVVVTGAGRGVGFETARALASLGARVVIAELDESTGESAARSIRAEFGDRSADFVHTDVGDEHSLEALVSAAGDVDIVVNNATVAPLGPVSDVPLDRWDLSYRVNLRGPVTLARLTVPGMIARKRGVFVAVSSVGGGYMSPYESLKAAQVELVSALAEELEGTGVYAFAIGPGQVDTPGLRAGVEQLASLYGMTPMEFTALNAEHLICAEDAGAGIAAAVALADRFHGTETNSMAGLSAITPIATASESPSPHVRSGASAVAGDSASLDSVIAALESQAAGWRERSVFERKWMERDFRKQTGRTAEELTAELRTAPPDSPELSVLLGLVDGYWAHYEQLARGNVRDPAKLAEALDSIERWRRDIADATPPAPR